MASKPESELGKRAEVAGEKFDIGNGDIVIAAITSCTNTSNPSVMLAAGLVARNAVAKGIKVKPWVKTSLAPGSKVVTEVIDKTIPVKVATTQNKNELEQIILEDKTQPEDFVIQIGKKIALSTRTYYASKI